MLFIINTFFLTVGIMFLLPIAIGVVVYLATTYPVMFWLSLGSLMIIFGIAFLSNYIDRKKQENTAQANRPRLRAIQQSFWEGFNKGRNKPANS